MDSFNRQICFNELSTLDKAENEDMLLLFSNFAKAIKSLKQQGFSGVRYEQGITSLSNEHRNIFELQRHPMGNTWFKFILSTARNPYIDPDTPAEERYVNEDFEVNINEEWAVGQGFTAAYLLDTIVISLATHPKWETSSFTIRNIKEKSIQGDVINTTSPQSSETDTIKFFVEQRTPLSLDKCETPPTKKSSKFRHDHGKDELMAVWKRLRNCEYIVSAINSLEFNPTGRNFVEQCFDNGTMHLRLVNSDAGYGMVIQTTGKSMRETIAIGEIITNKYSL